MRVKMSKPPPPAPTASAIGPCPTVIKIVGRPGTGSLPSTIAPPDHPISKNSHLDLGPRTLKLKIHQDIVILHMCGKLNQNRSMNEGYRAMTMFFSKNSHCDLDLGIS